MLKAGKEQREAQEKADKAAEQKRDGVAGHRADDFLARAREAEASG